MVNPPSTAAMTIMLPTMTAIGDSSSTVAADDRTARKEPGGSHFLYRKLTLPCCGRAGRIVAQSGNRVPFSLLLWHSAASSAQSIRAAESAVFTSMGPTRDDRVSLATLRYGRPSGEQI